MKKKPEIVHCVLKNAGSIVIDKMGEILCLGVSNTGVVCMWRILTVKG